MTAIALVLAAFAVLIAVLVIVYREATKPPPTFGEREHPCKNGCQYSHDVDMPYHQCAVGCRYEMMEDLHAQLKKVKEPK